MSITDSLKNRKHVVDYDTHHHMYCGRVDLKQLQIFYPFSTLAYFDKGK